MSGIAIRPHARSVVQVKDDLVAAIAQVQPVLARIGRRALGQRAEGDPQHWALADDLDGDVGCRHLRVGRCLATVEDDLGILRRVERGEHDRGLALAGADVRRIDSPCGELSAHVVAQCALTDLGDDGGVVTQSGGSHRDIGGGAADGLREGLRLEEARTLLLRVEVDADATDGDDLGDRHLLAHAWGDDIA